MIKYSTPPSSTSKALIDSYNKSPMGIMITTRDVRGLDDPDAGTGGSPEDFDADDQNETD